MWRGACCCLDIWDILFIYCESFLITSPLLVTLPPASGKTYISKLLAKRLKHVVYLDKDTLIALSKHMEYILNLKDILSEKNANLVVVWVDTSPEVVHERMICRNSERDTWKLAHWDEDLAECNFNIPSNLDDNV